MELTLQISESASRALNEKARAEGKSATEIAAAVLEAGLQPSTPRKKVRDLSDIAGTWVEDPEFDKAIAEQDRIDPEMWE